MKKFFAFLALLPLLVFADTIENIFFSSEEHIDERLIEMIDQEKEEIRSAIYQITSKKIAESLIAAQKRGVIVKMITSPDASSKAYDKLIKAPVDVKLYKPANRELLHHKFMIFKKNKADKSYVWIGSANFTPSGARNRESIVVLEGQESYARFLKEFDSL